VSGALSTVGEIDGVIWTSRLHLWGEVTAGQTGSITQSTFSVNGVVRAGTSSRIDATLSGGLSIQRLGGTVSRHHSNASQSHRDACLP
jgi:hypothetical protein